MIDLALEYPTRYTEYNSRPLPGTDKRFPMDVRSFVWPNDAQVKEQATKIVRKLDQHDSKATAIQRWVVKKLRYVEDDKKGCPEYWMFPVETLALKRCDCEDGAILIASMLLAVLPESEHWRVWVAAGLVQAGEGAAEGGHAYCVYIRESDHEPVILDWCYYEDSRIAVEDKPIATDVEMYKDVWFAFNHKESRAPSKLRMSGRMAK